MSTFVIVLILTEESTDLDITLQKSAQIDSIAE